MPTVPRTNLPHLLLIGGAVLSLASMATFGSLLSTLIYLVVMAVAAAAASWAAATAPPATRRITRIGACAVVLYALGDLTWWVITWAGGSPDPSLADVFYLSSYAALGATLLMMLMPLRPGRSTHWGLDVDVLIDVLSVVTVSVLVLWELVIRDSDLASGPSSVLYPVLDAVLIGLTLRVLTVPQARRRAGLMVMAALVCLTVGDFGYLESTSGRVGWLSDATWMVAVLLLGWTVVRLERQPIAAATGPVTPSNAGRLALAIGPLAVPPGLVVLEEALGREPESWGLVVGIVVLIALALVRTERLLAFERRTLRELAITRDAALGASRTKTAFLAGISHEIRTPMNGVLGLSRLLSDTSLGEHQRGYVQGIESAGESLMTLLNDVLDFAKFESGPVETEQLDFDVVELVEDVAAMVTEQAHHAGLELIAHIEPDVPRWLNGDPIRIRQILLNYAANAVKFTAYGEVVIRAALDEEGPEGPTVRFSVTDTGVGVAPEDHGRLFEPFTQADASTTRRYGGSGLGLAIVRRVADALQGRVGIDSVPGHGSTFWCALPLRTSERSHLVLTRPGRAVPGTRVLLVEDNRTAREVMGAQLEQWDLQVDAVATGTDAVCTLTSSAARGAPYDLAVVDRGLAGTDGLALAGRIHADPTLGRPTVVLLTTGPRVPSERLQGSGVNVHLSKPVQVSRLQAAVQRALGSNTALELPVHARPWRDLPPDRGVVLVVEDSEVNRMVAVGTLRQLGYLAEVAVNGQEAVRAVTSRRYDAVLMDCRMPVLDGYDATREIRRLEGEGPRTPIIAVTANATPEDRARCLAAGMDDHLAKPLDRRRLEDSLGRWVPESLRSDRRA